MLGLAAVLFVCVTVLVLGDWVIDYLTARDASDRTHHAPIIAARDALESRRVAVAEREVALKERLQAERPKRVPMPLDLHNRITAWEDEFAQDAERQTIEGLYAEFGEWDVVRQKLGPLAPAPQREGLVQ